MPERLAGAESQAHSALAGQQRGAVVAYWGMAILIVGLIGAVLLYVFAADDDTDAVAAIASQRMYGHNIELMGGKLALFADEFDRWFASLWHGKTLAYTVAALAVFVALACFGAARLISASAQDEQPPQRKDQ